MQEAILKLLINNIIIITSYYQYGVIFGKVSAELSDYPDKWIMYIQLPYVELPNETFNIT